MAGTLSRLKSAVRKWLLSVFCWPIDNLDPELNLWDQSEKVLFFKAAVVFLYFLEVWNLSRQHNLCWLHPLLSKIENSFKYKLLKPGLFIYIDIEQQQTTTTKTNSNHFLTWCQTVFDLLKLMRAVAVINNSEK